MKKHAIAAVVSAAILPSVPAFGQIEEVVVTAQKREQSLQDVPISITALSGERIQDTGLLMISEVV